MLDKIKGCLIGGAAGDALGYTVEFYSADMIFEEYGEKGIIKYDLDYESGKALISDDTQMTLFTANGILVANTRVRMRGIGGIPHMYIAESYQDWLRTQYETFEESKQKTAEPFVNRVSWLLDVPQLYDRRAPGGTCLSALIAKRERPQHEGFLDNPCNDKRGCGAVMRIAPLGLHYGKVPPEVLAKEAAEISAITHGHPLGYMPSALLSLMLQRIVFDQGAPALKDIVLDALETTCKVFHDKGYTDELRQLIERAVELAENNDSDLKNIRRLGGGWVGDEALAIAIYCALRYKDDFSKCIITAVNHDGDSDSTGAIAGNILGAYLGYDKMEEKWKQNLELSDVILEIAEDLYHGCPMGGEQCDDRDPAWEAKYILMKRYEG